MNSTIVCPFLRGLSLAMFSLAMSAMADDLPVNGNIFATGTLDINGNTASFGTSGANPGFSLLYTDGSSATIDFSASLAGANWVWRQGISNPQLKLDSTNTLSLFNPSTGVASIILNPTGYSGIGTTSPGAPLDITAVTSATVPAGLIVRRYNGSAQMIKIHQADGATHVIEASDSSDNQKPFIIRKLISDNINPVDTVGHSDIQFQIYQKNGLGVAPLTLQAVTGNVGVGIGNPTAKLEVAGNLKVSGSISSTGAFNPAGAINLASGQSLTLANADNSVSINSPGSGRLQFNVAGNSFEARQGGIMIPAGNRLMDQNSNTMLGFGYTATGVNNIQIDNAPTGQSPVIRSVGLDTNIGLILAPKGTGSVGIGTNTPGADNFGAGKTKLDVVGSGGTNIVVQDTTKYASVGAAGQAEGNLVLRDMGTTPGSQIWNLNSNDGILSFRRLTDNYTTVLSTPMALTGAGNIGIGTVAPVNKLDVSGNASIGGSKTLSGTYQVSPWPAMNSLIVSGADTANGFGGIYAGSNNTEAAGQTLGSFGFLQKVSGKSGTANAGLKALLEAVSVGAGGTTGGFGADLLFYTRPDNYNANPPERLRITAGGNVGIGTSAPDAKLQVAGGTGVAISLYNTGNASGDTTQISLGANPSIPQGGVLIKSIRTSGSGANTDLSVATTLSGVQVERLRITSVGNVGVGIAIPAEKLDVVGNAKISGTLMVGGTSVLTTTGNGSGLTGLSASQLTTGTLPSTRGGAGTINGMLKANGSGIVSPAIAGIDYVSRWAELSGATSEGGEELSSLNLTFNGGGHIFIDSETGQIGMYDSSGTQVQLLLDAGNAKIGILDTANGDLAYLSVSDTVWRFDNPSPVSDFDIEASWLTARRSYLLPDVSGVFVLSDLDGNVGIGTTAPVAKLDVAGDVQISGDVKMKNNAVIRISPAGDLSMGTFNVGTNPAN